MVSDMEVRVKQKCVTEFFHAEKNAPTDIHRHLLNIHGDQTVDMSTMMWWVVCFSSRDSHVRDRPCSRRLHTVVSSRNEKHLDQIISANRRKKSTLTATL
jgi:hypothetical protein